MVLELMLSCFEEFLDRVLAALVDLAILEDLPEPIKRG